MRLTAQRILAEHLRDDRIKDQRSADPPSPRFWPGIRLDLAGATLIDFNLYRVVMADANFDRGDLHRHRAVLRGDLHRRRCSSAGRPSPATPRSAGRPSAARRLQPRRPSPATPGSARRPSATTPTSTRRPSAATPRSTGRPSTASPSSSRATFTGDAMFAQGDLQRRRLVHRGDLYRPRPVRRSDLHRRCRLPRGDLRRRHRLREASIRRRRGQVAVQAKHASCHPAPSMSGRRDGTSDQTAKADTWSSARSTTLSARTATVALDLPRRGGRRDQRRPGGLQVTVGIRRGGDSQRTRREHKFMVGNELSLTPTPPAPGSQASCYTSCCQLASMSSGAVSVNDRL